MDKKNILILFTICIIFCLNQTFATDYNDTILNTNQNSEYYNPLLNIHGKYSNNSSIKLLTFSDNTIEDKYTDESNYTVKFNKSRPIYFAMDHTNAKDQQIRDTIINRLKSEGFNVVSAEIGPNKMSQNTHYLYEHNISNAIVFHLFNGVDPSTIRELATNGTDNRGRIVRQNGNDVVLAWFYDSVDCVHENATGTKYVHGSETGPSLENPRQYMLDNDIIGICTSSDMGKHKEDADYTGEKTVEEFMKLFEN